MTRKINPLSKRAEELAPPSQSAANQPLTNSEELLADTVEPGSTSLQDSVIDDLGRRTAEMLDDAIIANDIAAVRAALAAGADINATVYEINALTGAAGNGSLELVEFLLEQGADVNATSCRDCRTALHWAAEKQDATIARLLIGQGANLDARDIDGETPLHQAITFKAEQVALALVMAGCDVTATDNYGSSPLHFAADNGNQTIAEALLTRGANINLRDVYLLTPLHRAAMRRRDDLVSFLIEQGADIDAKDCEGLTAADCAKARDAEETRIPMLRRIVKWYRSRIHEL